MDKLGTGSKGSLKSLDKVKKEIWNNNGNI